MTRKAMGQLIWRRANWSRRVEVKVVKVTRKEIKIQSQVIRGQLESGGQ